MRSVVPLLFLALLIGEAIFLGNIVIIEEEVVTQMPGEQELAIPNIGRIEILNGCGISGLADQFANYLRRYQFDVKSTANAATWDYEKTLVISRIPDRTIAQNVAKVLHCAEPLFLRTEQTAYDVTVIIGHNYKEISYE